MKMRLFHAFLDEPILKEWLSALSLPLSLAEDLPLLGVVALDEESLLAMGFLRKVEGNYALMDSLIANPTRPGKARSAALDLVVEVLIQKAKKQQLKSVLANTTESAILKRSERHGFKRLPHVTIGLDLGGIS